jgi:hypothetical protein
MISSSFHVSLSTLLSEGKSRFPLSPAGDFQERQRPLPLSSFLEQVAKR